MIDRLLARAGAPVDIASVVVFRVAFGGLMVAQLVYFAVEAHEYWIEPPLHFTYLGFDWIKPLPAPWLYALIALVGVCGLLTMVGLWYRVSVGLFCIGFTYLFLIERAKYQNHYYLICLLSFLLVFVPAHRAFSIDAKRHPELRSSTTPAWTLWLLRLQLAIVFVYAGIAKLNPDWFQGEPIRTWLMARSHFPVIGPLLQSEVVVYFICYGGAVFDLLVVPGLLWPPTRPIAFATSTFFHLSNAILFGLGVFPWMALAATTLFFSPDWPRRVLAKIPAVARRLGVTTVRARQPATADAPLSLPHPATAAVLGVYLLVQLLLPLRPFLYPGNVSWTEEGHEFAWHMRLRSKHGRVKFTITDPKTGASRTVDPSQLIPHWQVREMAGKPDFILQFVHHLADELRAAGEGDVEIRATTSVSLNGRRPQTLVDPTVNLAAEERDWLADEWIVPLHEPLRAYTLPRSLPRLRRTPVVLSP